jgi:hypothetical protein
LVVALPSAALASTAPYPDDLLGWSACRWAPDEVVSVGISRQWPFPGPAFSDRLDEAIARWDSVLATTTDRPRLLRYDGAPDIVVEYHQPSPGDDPDGALAETFIMRRTDTTLSNDIGRCPDRRRGRHAMAAAAIRIAPRDDWFTGPDTDVGSWQACGRALAQMVVTNCSDEVDFASTITHELGHTLVAYHPQTLDAVDGRPIDSEGSATRAAACAEVVGRFDDQATLCAGQGRWRAEQRTLSDWDVETVKRQYADGRGALS